MKDPKKKDKLYYNEKKIDMAKFSKGLNKIE